jgi:hypothetical protein
MTGPVHWPGHRPVTGFDERPDLHYLKEGQGAGSHQITRGAGVWMPGSRIFSTLRIPEKIFEFFAGYCPNQLLGFFLRIFLENIHKKMFGIFSLTGSGTLFGTSFFSGFSWYESVYP